MRIWYDVEKQLVRMIPRTNPIARVMQHLEHFIACLVQVPGLGHMKPFLSFFTPLVVAWGTPVQ